MKAWVARFMIWARHLWHDVRIIQHKVIPQNKKQSLDDVPDMASGMLPWLDTCITLAPTLVELDLKCLEHGEVVACVVACDVAYLGVMRSLAEWNKT